MRRLRHIVLISPKGPLYRHRGGILRRSLRYMPLTLPTLAALVPEGLAERVTCIDEGIEELDPGLEADLVGMTVITGNAVRAYELPAIFRRRRIPVVLGGPHVTLAPGDAQPHARSRFFATTSSSSAAWGLRRLVPLRIRWVSQGSVDMTRDPELMELLVESGCLGNVIGFESLDPRNLAAMNKRPNLPATGWDAYESACRVLRDHHLQTWAAFTLGHDHDTPESIRETYDFAMEQKFCFAAFNILMPYPGTPLYDRLAREGRLLWGGRWWLHPEYRFNHAAFRPARMSPDELTEACWDCRKRWNRRSAIFKRVWDPKTHLSSPLRLGIYLRYNPLYAREAFKKQGMRFGLR